MLKNNHKNNDIANIGLLTKKPNAFSIQLKKQIGFSLIEVLISALILSTSLLGVLSMQMIGMKGTHHSYMKQQAIGIVQNVMERMSANRDAVINGDYVFNSENLNCATSRPSCSTSNCTSQQIALLDKLILACGYKADNSAPPTGGVVIQNATDIVALSGGTINVTCRSACVLGDVTVQVGWKERAIGDEVTDSDFIKMNLRIGTNQ